MYIYTYTIKRTKQIKWLFCLQRVSCTVYIGFLMILRYLYHPYVSRQCKETSLMPQWEDLEYPCAFHFFLMPTFFAESVYSDCLVPWGWAVGEAKKRLAWLAWLAWLACVFRTDSAGQEASGRSGWTKRKCAALPSVSPMVKVFQSNSMPHLLQSFLFEKEQTMEYFLTVDLISSNCYSWGLMGGPATQLTTFLIHLRFSDW